MEKHIIKYELLKTLFDRNIKKFAVNFEAGINILVGENGSGKSTLLMLLSDKEYVEKLGVKHKITFSPEVTKIGIEFMFFDTEKNNPRIVSDLSGHAGNIGNIISSHFKSHGETMFPILEHISKMKNIIIFIDEPESGISLKNQMKLWQAFLQAQKNGCQLFISTHSWVFIKNTNFVFDMQTKKWIESDLFIKNSLN